MNMVRGPVRTEVGQVDFSSCSSNRASDIFSLNRY